MQNKDKNSGWRYYNHALLPDCEPHEEADIDALNNPQTWKTDKGVPLFARWTSNYDCGYETQWWWCILDKPFDIQLIKSKNRYYIKKGIENFDVKFISAEYAEQIYEVYCAATKTYLNISKIDKTKFCADIAKGNSLIFGAFSKNSEQLVAWARIDVKEKFIGLTSQKANPEFEKLQVNAALINGILEYFKDDLASGKYICDGEKNIYHTTHFQEYLEKYFCFRKAYCYLNLMYAPRVYIYIQILYPFRKILSRLPFSSIKRISAVLVMEEIVRTQKYLTQKTMNDNHVRLSLL